MSSRYDCSDVRQRAAGLRAAVAAVRRGELIVLPTDTIYGIAADAFSARAVDALLSARGGSRSAPPPVMIGSVRAATALIEDTGSAAQDFIDEFWPGALTLVCRASRTLSWDLGDTRGTVSVRMPLQAVALELLKETGPLAVSSANVSGSPAATTVDEAQAQLGDSVAVYLDDGTCPGGVTSTILDLTGLMPRLLREGAISLGRLSAVATVTPLTPDEPAPAHNLGESGTDDPDTHEVPVTSEAPADDAAPRAQGEA